MPVGATAAPASADDGVGRRRNNLTRTSLTSRDQENVVQQVCPVPALTHWAIACRAWHTLVAWKHQCSKHLQAAAAGFERHRCSPCLR